MLFTELRFAVFFALAFAITWFLPRNGARKLWLLACSYSFYAAWDWRFLSLILLSTCVDYFAGGRMARESERTARRRYLWLSVGVNLGTLGFFKYCNFFVDSAVELGTWLGLAPSPHTLNIILPLGISFYTFQTLSYTIDIYRRQLEPTRSPLDFALFVAFFPQLVAGPIVRAAGFLPQLREKRLLVDVAFRANLTLFLLGYIKKACVANHIAKAIDPVFAAPELYDAASLWIASFLYTLQIYCDFSGYSDMAIASAGLLGYRLTANFDFPYLARSIRDYWRRWHISLSTWFRDYLYIPLGGGRAGSWRVGANLCTVFLLCGLWHGANWTFVVWGIYHGSFLLLERSVSLDRLPNWLAHIYVLLVVNIGFVVFRSADIFTASSYLAGLLGVNKAPLIAPELPLDPRWILLLLGFAVVHVSFARLDPVRRAQQLPPVLFSPLFGAAVALTLLSVAAGYQPFIYFQF